MHGTSHSELPNGMSLCGKKTYSFSTYFSCHDCLKISIDNLPNGPWEMYAHKNSRGNFCSIGHEFFCKMHDSKAKIHKVLLEVDENGEYWSWQDMRENIPHMIWDNEISFSVCFGRDYRDMIKAYKGKLTKLRITEIV